MVIVLQKIVNEIIQFDRIEQFQFDAINVHGMIFLYSVTCCCQRFVYSLSVTITHECQC